MLFLLHRWLIRNLVAMSSIRGALMAGLTLFSIRASGRTVSSLNTPMILLQMLGLLLSLFMSHFLMKMRYVSKMVPLFIIVE